MFDYRWLEESDYPELCKWWMDFKFPVPPKKMLPDNGKCGIMVSKKGVNICSAFLYFTNSCFAFVQFAASNFNYREKDRKEAFKLLYEVLEAVARKEGFELMYSTVKREPLINKMKEFGWREGSHTIEMIKQLK